MRAVSSAGLDGAMDRRSLAALKARVRPIGPSRGLTLEQAASAMRLNGDVAGFHAAVAHAERVLELSGALDGRLERELVARAMQLARMCDAMARELEPAPDRA